MADFKATFLRILLKSVRGAGVKELLFDLWEDIKVSFILDRFSDPWTFRSDVIRSRLVPIRWTLREWLAVLSVWLLK